MPKPVYIICSESGSEDKVTGLVSHFKVVEQIILQELRPPEEGKPVVIPTMPFQFMVVWAMSEDDQIGEEYEVRHSLFLPPDRKEMPLPGGSIFFEEGKTHYRFMVVLTGLTFREPGLFKVESRIRRSGTEDWSIQVYEIPIIKHAPPIKLGVQMDEIGETDAPAEETAP